jgi:DNA-binding beta-propeller fold protein YncE
MAPSYAGAGPTATHPRRRGFNAVVGPVAVGQRPGDISAALGATAIAVGAGAAWVSDDIDDTVSRIDPSGASEVVPVGQGANGVAVGDGSVWVANTLDGTATRIDPATTATHAIIPTMRAGRPGLGWSPGARCDSPLRCPSRLPAEWH